MADSHSASESDSASSTSERCSYRTWYPQSDQEREQWFRQIARTIADEPDAFGIAPSRAAELIELADRFEDAMTKATGPGTRCGPTIAAKNEVREEAMPIFRAVLAQIRTDARVSDALKAALRITVKRERTRKPTPPPTSVPLLSLISSNTDGLRMCYADEWRPDSRAKPRGVARLQIYAVPADRPTADPADGVFLGSFSRSPFTLTYPSELEGAAVTLYGRWCTATNLAGRWSAGVPLRLITIGSITIPPPPEAAPEPAPEAVCEPSAQDDRSQSPPLPSAMIEALPTGERARARKLQ